MLQYLWLVPALPFAGFVVLALFGPGMGRALAALVGVGSVGLSAVVSLLVVWSYATLAGGHAFSQTLWTWMQVGNFNPSISLHLDALSAVFMLVITGVGFLIHLYSAEYMEGEEGYSRFFAYMNLFVGSMLTLVLAGNFLLLFLGWEGVGLCSYLLIGFWYKDPANVRAARKAFVVTRVGDTAMMIGLFLILTNLGTLQIQDAMAKAQQVWPVGSAMAVAAAALLLGGAVGKSAQLPLQTWLPDAMAGPTPVSALIHAATMVTAGVYLVARTNVLFTLAPSVLLAVAVIGALTLLIAGFSALAQHDIKRILAYSTISQIGYMFLALGVGAWSAGVFHFVTHAFFKALLFLAAGVVILAMHHEQNIFRMGGLRRELPFTFWVFLVGAASLSALPLVTAGFFSKDLILEEVWASPRGGMWLWAAGMVGGFVTSLYAFRAVFIVFFGAAHHRAERQPDWRMALPLAVLAAGAVVAGVLEMPRNLGHVTVLSDFLHGVLPAFEGKVTAETELMLQLSASLLSLAGIYVAYLLYLRNRAPAERPAEVPPGGALGRFWLAGWGFDWLYDWLFVKPVVWIARVNRHDFVDVFYQGIAVLSWLLHRALSATESGVLRWYAGGVALGALLLIALGILT